MLQTLSVQKDIIPLTVLGNHHLPDGIPTMGFWEAIHRCRKPLASGKPRIFHARRNDEMIQALLLKRVFGCHLRIVFTSTAQRYHSRFTKWLMRQMDGIISTSSSAAAYLDKPPDLIVPHGIDEKLYTPSEDKAHDWQTLGYPGECGIGIFGRVREQKGVDVLIDAALPLLKMHPSYTVLVVGEITPSQQSFVDRQKEKLAQAGLNERVIFTGKQPFDKLPKLFRAMSIVAALSRNEGFGLTVLEAMASGTAVIASEAGAWKDIISSESLGMCVPCGDVEATRRGLNELMSNPQKLEAMSTAARAHVEKHYTIRREALQLTDYYRSLASA